MWKVRVFVFSSVCVCVCSVKVVKSGEQFGAPVLRFRVTRKKDQDLSETSVLND